MSVKMGWFHVVFISLCVFKGTWPFQWTSDHSDGAVTYTCRGQDLHLPWNFTLSHGEQVSVIQWYFRGQSEELVAMVDSHGQFQPTASFANRVEFVPPAGIVVKNVVPSDSGNYTVQVISHTGPNRFPDQRLTVDVDVTDNVPPSSDHDVLTATQERSAVYNNDTDQWAICLTCGNFSSLGHPPVDVVWTTPTGERKASTSFKNGSFLLTLDNPVKGGCYSCSLDPSSPAAACLSGSAGLLQRADVIVDAVEARLTVIEARQEVEITRLQQQNQQLTSQVNNLTSEVNSIRDNDVNLTSAVHTLEAANAGLVAKEGNLTDYIRELEQNLTQHIHDFHQLQLFLDGPCGNHIVMNDAWRDVNTRGGSHCDDHLTAGWYRFELDGNNAFMPTSCVKEYHCGTHVTLWLDLEGRPMPDLGQQTTGRAYGSYSGCRETQNTPVAVLNCSAFYVYHLMPATTCNYAYCATTQLNPVLTTVKTTSTSVSPAFGNTTTAAAPSFNVSTGVPSLTSTPSHPAG